MSPLPPARPCWSSSRDARGGQGGVGFGLPQKCRQIEAQHQSRGPQDGRGFREQTLRRGRPEASGRARVGAERGGPASAPKAALPCCPAEGGGRTRARRAPRWRWRCLDPGWRWAHVPVGSPGPQGGSSQPFLALETAPPGVQGRLAGLTGSCVVPPGHLKTRAQVCILTALHPDVCLWREGHGRGQVCVTDPLVGGHVSSGF